MEINNLFKLLAISNENERQAKSNQPPRDRYFRQEHPSLTEGEYRPLAQSKQELTPQQVVNLYVEQMQAAKRHLSADYSAILGHLTNTFSHSFPNGAPVPLEEVLNAYGNPLLQDTLYTQIGDSEVGKIQQYLIDNATHIAALRSQDMEIKTFPENLTDWLTKQHIQVDQETRTAIQALSSQQTLVQREQSELQRFQHISSQYNAELEQQRQSREEIKTQLELAYKEVGFKDFPFAQFMSNRASGLPVMTTATGSPHQAAEKISEWSQLYDSELSKLEELQRKVEGFPNMAVWAKSNGFNHPWLHS